MKLDKFFFAAATVLFFFFSLGVASSDDTTLPQIVITGNSTIREDVIVYMSGLSQNPDLSAEEVKKRLQTTNLFSRVEVSRTDSAVQIDLKQKLTWFAIPYFSKDASVSVYGLAFGKLAVGGQDMLVVGRGQTGSGNKQAALFFRQNWVKNTPWSVGASLDFEDSLKRIFNERKVVHHTRNQMHGGSIQLAYRFSPYFSLALNNYFEYHRFEQPTGEFDNGFQWSHRLTTEYNRFYVDEGLSDGYAGRAFFEHTNPASTFQFYKMGLHSAFSPFRRGNFNWIIRPRVEFSPSLPRYQLFELGGGRLRSFATQQFRDRHYVMAQNDFLLASFDFWVLKLRPLVYADWAYIQNQGRTGLGSGFQIYIRDVAIPAVQFFAGYGFNPNGFAASAAIGPQF
ncbi:MAG: hypothetical protein AB1540_16205 [Bdellovibrionota bacterium]